MELNNVNNCFNAPVKGFAPGRGYLSITPYCTSRNYQKCQVLWVWLTPLPWGKPLTGTYGGPGFPSEYVFQNWASEILN